ncbi:MAG: nodulation protein NfeD [Pseudomonadota bacterium]
MAGMNFRGLRSGVRHAGAIFVVALLLGLSGLVTGQDPDGGRFGLMLQIEGSIGPATTDHIARNLEQAAARGAEVFILQIDTPGGLDSSMRDIVKAILESPVPVATYVAPGGARAASAGTYILYASHVAAMAPATNLGAATPVKLGGFPGMPDEKEDKEADEDQDDLSASERKIINDAAAYIRGLAERHGRNAEWAEQAVREGVSLTAREALELEVIDFVATDLGDLLAQIDGHRVSAAGRERVLNTDGIAIERVAPDWRSRLLSVITDPNVAYILLLIGIYGLIFELSNPGAILPGVTGAIALLLALYAFQVLPINYAGLALIFFGIVFMIAEAFVPSFGILGLGGVIAFVAGSVILMEAENLAISVPLIASVALVSAVFFIWVIGRFIRLRRRRAKTGEEELVGSVGVALKDFEGTGRVRVHSENWQARTKGAVKKGQRVKVVAVDGLSLNVEPVQEDD